MKLLAGQRTTWLALCQVARYHTSEEKVSVLENQSRKAPWTPLPKLTGGSRRPRGRTEAPNLLMPNSHFAQDRPILPLSPGIWEAPEQGDLDGSGRTKGGDTLVPSYGSRELTMLSRGLGFCPALRGLAWASLAAREQGSHNSGHSPTPSTEKFVHSNSVGCLWGSCLESPA